MTIKPLASVNNIEFEAAADICNEISEILRAKSDEIKQQANLVQGEQKNLYLIQAVMLDKRASLYCEEGKRALAGSMTAHDRSFNHHAYYLSQLHMDRKKFIHSVEVQPS